VLVIRRSPLLDLRTVATSGVSPIDMPAGVVQPVARQFRAPRLKVPLGIRPYQAYRFAVGAVRSFAWRPPRSRRR